MNRNRFLAGAIILAAFTILVTAALVIRLRQSYSEPALIGQREPIKRLGYCSSAQVRPCILSFKLNARGRLVIHILIARSAPRNFYLKIRREGVESIYKCRKMADSSTSFSCRGETMPIGEPLQFLMLSTKKSIVLAEGRFSIIGLPIATPEIALPSTPTPPVFNHLPR